MKKISIIIIMMVISFSAVFADTATCIFTVTGGEGEDFCYGKHMYNVITNTYYYNTDTICLPSDNYTWSISHYWDPNGVPPLQVVLGWILIRESTGTIYTKDIGNTSIIVNIPSFELSPENNND